MWFSELVPKHSQGETLAPQSLGCFLLPALYTHLREIRQSSPVRVPETPRKAKYNLQPSSACVGQVYLGLRLSAENLHFFHHERDKGREKGRVSTRLPQEMVICNDHPSIRQLLRESRKDG